MFKRLITLAAAVATLTGVAAADRPVKVRHTDKRTTELTLDRQDHCIMLPIEEGAPEVPVQIVDGDRVIQTLHVRLAQFEVDYFMPYFLADYPEADAIRVRDLHRGALCWSKIHAADHYAYPEEKYRPAWHFAPAYGWMNDPNGMFYKDGVWHLYYQHNPYGAMWGNMHWGHATSRDLISWEHHGDALRPDALGTIFSGSAVVDHNNTAGYGKGAVLAFYTSAAHVQQQSMAYSTDSGMTFTKYENNPVIPSDLRDCRDPKVFRYEPLDQWNLVIAVGDHMEIWSSKNLKEWKHESDFSGYGGRDGVWECPDLFELPVDGDAKNTRWVLFSTNYSNTLRAGGTQYFVGTFDGHEFRCETDPSLTRWIDKGRNHYAAVTWDNAPDNRRVLLPWIAGWPYQSLKKPVQIRCIQGAPRDLSLYTHEGVVYLAVTPSKELLALRGAEALKTPKFRLAKEGVRSFALPGEGLCEVEVTLRDVKAAKAGFRLSNNLGEEVVVSYEPASGRFLLDFSKSGQVDYSRDRHARSLVTVAASAEGLSGAASETYAPLAADGSLSLRLLLDRCSIECFEQSGRFAISDYIFPTEPYDRIEFFGEGGDFRVEKFSAYPLVPKQ